MASLMGRGDALNGDSSTEENANEFSSESEEGESDELSDDSLKAAPAKLPLKPGKVQKDAVPNSWDTSGAESEEETVAGNANGPTAESFSDSDRYSEDSDVSSTEGLADVLLAMRKLQAGFDAKFKAMWA